MFPGTLLHEVPQNHAKRVVIFYEPSKTAQMRIATLAEVVLRGHGQPLIWHDASSCLCLEIVEPDAIHML